MNSELPVVFDVDGVLADFALHFTRLAHRHFPQVPIGSAGAQSTWLFAHDETFNDQLWDFIKQATGWWEACPLLATIGDIEAMHTIEQPIVYMTSRVGRHPRQATKTWLAAHRFPVGDVIVTHEKVDAIKKLGGCTAIIEDRPDNIQQLADASIRVVARDWPYNRHVEDAERVSSVSEFVEKVRRR